MKQIATLTFVLVSTVLFAQSIEKKVGSFNKIIASPKINLVLVEGTEESVKINYANVDASKIRVTVKNKTLRIYLDGSRFTEKRERVQLDGEVRKENVYRHASITAYVTYNKLQKLVVRGEQEVDVRGPISGKKFKLSAYGECDITLASLDAGKFKASLYGQHTLKIKSGQVDTQQYKLFGENKIDALAIQSVDAYSTTYGESKLKVNANENLRLVTFGESDVWMRGNAEVNKITLGEVSFKK